MLVRLFREHHQVLTEAVNEVYQRRGEPNRVSEMTRLALIAFTKLFRILRVFVQGNEANTRALSGDIEAMLPYYGEMYMLGAVRGWGPAGELEEAMFGFQSAMFGTPSPLVDDFERMKNYLGKLDLKLMHAQLRHTLDVYS